MTAMSPAFKPVAEILLQARACGKLMGSTDFFNILQANMISPTVDIQELSDFVAEIIQCDDPLEAEKVAKRYDLTIEI